MTREAIKKDRAVRKLVRGFDNQDSKTKRVMFPILLGIIKKI